MFGQKKFPNVDVREAQRLQARGHVLLDVREDDEWASGHAPNAEHLPLPAVPAGAAQYADRSVLTVCRSGRRSAAAAAALVKAGVDVRNVDGGMVAWSAAGLPIVDDAGAPGSVA